MRRWVFLTIVLAWVSTPSGQGQAASQEPEATPQQAQDAPQQPVFRTGVNFVRVDVIVTDDDDNPVTELTIDDFEVYEDDQLQALETFQLVQITPDSLIDDPVRPIRNEFDEEREAARPDVRLFAIFLDDYHVRLGASLRVREPLIEFVESLAPTDMVGIMYPLTSLVDLRMTRNHAAIIEEIKRFQGRKYDYEPRNQFEFQYARAPAMTVEQIRNEVSLTGLRALVTRLGGLREGRKSVILVSEGFTNILPPQMRRTDATQLADPRQQNPFVTSGNPREQAMQMTADLSLQTDLQRLFDGANRANTSIYSLDPRGLASFEFDINEGVSFGSDRNTLNATINTLRSISETTDGYAIVNTNDPRQGLQRAVRDASTYYLLGYNSADAPADGKFHEIKVRVPGHDVEVRARRGFWAMSPEDLERIETTSAAPETPSEVDLALSLLGARRNQRFVQTWIGMGQGDDGLTRVTFVWRPAPRVPGRRRAEPAKVGLTVSGNGGVSVFQGEIPDGPVVLSDDGTADPGWAVFDVAPGALQLALSVRGVGGGVIDNDLLHFNVQDFTGTEVTLGSPRVFRAQNAFEMRQLRTDPNPIPETGREFRRTDRLLVHVEAYGPGTAVPEVTARLLNRSGQSMADLPVQVPTEASAPYVLDLPLASLAPGEYLISLTAAMADASAEQLIAIRVTS
ncbi:MAG: VWA domain-containing protein [Vicinamibacterales bacterium]|jgi:VWFA-related protein|nr:VWA domain-containing protein [Vicinamibacterales bacterium]MDP7472682.1 VWA domain-containing protein [Vicinamibacterales bacterium]MDP7671259.1 VWA domain-containing protein [Vicinamibacterales bacterium]HJO38825.1 VWA domain-containing protein [Vicinamibacterales bacterium]